MSKAIADLTEEELKLDILRFSWTHGFNISPEKNLDRYVKRLKSTGHCACHDDRAYCPCVEAYEDVMGKGYCTCRLFINNDHLKVVQERIKRKIQANPLYRPDK